MPNPEQIILGFVFTNYNSAEHTLSAVKSIADNVSSDLYKIVIVDNNSAQPDKKALARIESQNAQVKVIFSDINHGYFKGLNLGINYFRKAFPAITHMVIGNNDLLFPDNFYKSILSNLAIFEKYPVISPDIETLDGFHQNPHVIKKIHPLREVIYDLYYTSYNFAVAIQSLAKLTHKFTDRNDEKEYENAQEIYQGHGSCYIIGPVFFKHFSELFAPTFLMYEEFFLAVQLHEKKMKTFYFPGIKLYHVGSSSINKVSAKSIWKFAKESHKYYRKYVSWTKGL